MTDKRVLSGSSMTPSLVADAAAAFKFITLEDPQDNAPNGMLRRFVSIRSVVSTSSSFALRKQEAQDQPRVSRQIGKGFCAEIFDIPGACRVIKRAYTSNPAKARELWNDFGEHLRISEALQSVSGTADIDIFIPQPAYYVTAKKYHSWMKVHEPQLGGGESETIPAALREPSDILVSERILPLPKPVREQLIHMFCPPSQVDYALTSIDNKDCIVRIYLGVQRANPYQASNPGEPFSLRNFELSLDRMNEIGIDPLQFVAPMAESLALMHWKANQDARDVEFVLGSAPEGRKITSRDFAELNKMGNPVTTWQDPRDIAENNLTYTRRTVCMWLLDFNQVSRITKDAQGVEKAVDAFWQNDPYYPRPWSPQLWEQFKSAYLAFSSKISPGNVLPEQFISRVEDDARSRTNPLHAPPRSAGAPPQMGEKSPAKKGKKPRRYAS